MKILWFTWKDLKHPQAGGAEVVNEELAKRLMQDGNEVIFVVGGYKGCNKEETINGYKVVRLGNRYTVYWHAWKYYRKNLKGWADLVIDEVNTLPFFAKFYVKERNILFIHQLAREIWFYQAGFPINVLGYLFEPIWLWLLKSCNVIVVSNSTRDNLLRFGFSRKNIDIIPEGVSILPVKSLDSIRKYDTPTILSLGSMRKMKRTKDQIKAFELAKNKIPSLRLKIAGDSGGKYGKQVLEMIRISQYSNDIDYVGRIKESLKIKLMQKCHIILVTSVKEGWGLIVTEAATQGTPAVVYGVDGLRDSVQDGVTGICCDSNPQSMSTAVISLLLNGSRRYATMRKNAHQWNQQFNFDASYATFKRDIKLSK